MYKRYSISNSNIYIIRLVTETVLKYVLYIIYIIYYIYIIPQIANLVNHYAPLAKSKYNYIRRSIG